MIEKEIVINNHKYFISIDANGKATAKTFNDKYQVWINVNFNDDLDVSTEITEEIKDILKKEYIDRLNELIQKDILQVLNNQVYEQGLISFEVYQKAKHKIAKG